jgi:hypothetical protein
MLSTYWPGLVRSRAQRAPQAGCVVAMRAGEGTVQVPAVVVCRDRITDSTLARCSALRSCHCDGIIELLDDANIGEPDCLHGGGRVTKAAKLEN